MPRKQKCACRTRAGGLHVLTMTYQVDALARPFRYAVCGAKIRCRDYADFRTQSKARELREVLAEFQLNLLEPTRIETENIVQERGEPETIAVQAEFACGSSAVGISIARGSSEYFSTGLRNAVNLARLPV